MKFDPVAIAKPLEDFDPVAHAKPLKDFDPVSFAQPLEESTVSNLAEKHLGIQPGAIKKAFGGDTASIADQAEMGSEVSAEMASPLGKGVPVRQDFVNRTRTDLLEGGTIAKAPGVLQTVQKNVLEDKEFPKQLDAVGGALEKGPATPEEQEFSNPLTTLKEGAKATGRAVQAFAATVQGDEQKVLDLRKEQAEAEKAPELAAMLSDLQMRQELLGQEDTGWLAAAKSVGESMAWNPTGAAHLIIEQTPNGLVPLGTGAAGFLIGGVPGGIAGLFGGNVVLSSGFRALESGGDMFSPEQQSEVLKKGAIEGGVITAVDVATLGISHFVLGTAKRAVETATRETLKKFGVGADGDIQAGLKAALQNPEIVDAVRAAQTRAYGAATTLGQRLGRGVGVTALEGFGEGTGAYLGKLAADGEASKMEAIVEGISGVAAGGVQSAALAAMQQKETAKLVDETKVQTDAERTVESDLHMEELKQQLGAIEEEPIITEPIVPLTPEEEVAAKQQQRIIAEGTESILPDPEAVEDTIGMDEMMLDPLYKQPLEWETALKEHMQRDMDAGISEVVARRRALEALPEMTPMTQRPITWSSVPEQVGMNLKQAKLAPGSVTVVGGFNEQYSPAYTQALGSTVQEWAKKYLGKDEKIVLNLSGLEGSAVGGYQQTPSGIHVISPRELVRTELSERFTEKGVTLDMTQPGQQGYNTFTQQQTFGGLTHEFGHAVAMGNFNSAMPEQYMGIVGKLDSGKLYTEKQLGEMPAPEAAVIRDYQQRKADILSGKMSAEAMIENWIGTWKLGRDLMKGQSRDLYSYAKEVLLREAKLMGKPHLSSTPLNQISALELIHAMGRETRVEQQMNAKGEPTTRRIQPDAEEIAASNRKSEAYYLQFSEFMAEQFSRHAHERDIGKGTALGLYFQRALAALRSFFQALKGRDGRSGESIVKAGTAFNDWIDQLHVSRALGEAEAKRRRANARKFKARMERGLKEIKEMTPEKLVKKVVNAIRQKEEEAGEGNTIEDLEYLAEDKDAKEKLKERIREMYPNIHDRERAELMRMVGQGRVLEVEDQLAYTISERTKEDRGTVKELKQKLKDEFKKETGHSIDAADLMEAGAAVRQEPSPLSVRARELARQFKELSVKSPYLFHTTTADRLPSILEQGLIPNALRRNPGVSGEGKISFGANEATARYYGTGQDVLLRVKKGHNVKVAADLLAGEGAYTTEQPIPPEALELKQGKQWIPLQDLTEEMLAKAQQDKDGGYTETPDGQAVEETLSKIVPKKEASLWRKAVNFTADIGYKLVQLQQISHESSDAGVRAFVTYQNQMLALKNNLLQKGTVVAETWENLSRKHQEQLDTLLMKELENGIHHTDLEQDIGTGKWRHVAGENYRKFAETQGINLANKEGEALTQLVLDIKNSILQHIQVTEATAVEIIRDKYAKAPLVAKQKEVEIRTIAQKWREAPYVPQGRYGNHVVKVFANAADGTRKMVYRAHFENAATQDKMAKELKKKGLDVEYGKIDDETSMQLALPTEFLSVLADSGEFTSDQLEKIGEAMLPLKGDKAFSRFIRDADRTAGASQDRLRDYANWVEDSANFISKLAYGRKLTKARAVTKHSMEQAKGLGQIEEARDKQRILDTMTKSQEFMMHPLEEWFKTRSVVALTFLMWAPKTALMNLTGLFQTWAAVTADYGDIQGNAIMAKATKDLMIGKMSFDENWAIDQALKDGLIDQGFGYFMSGLANAGNLARRVRPTIGGKAARAFVDLGMWPFKAVETANRKLTLLTVYRAEFAGNKKAGMNADEAMRSAYETASRYTRLLQNDYASGNRPEILRGGKSIFMVFLSYPQYMLWVMSGGFERGTRLAATLKGQDPRSRFGGMTMRMWLIFLALSGFEGLPFGEAIGDLLQKMWNLFGGSENLRVEAHRFMKDTLGIEDRYWRDVVQRGFLHDVLGVDLSGSYSLGKPLPGLGLINPHSDNWREFVGEAFAEFAGPFGGVAKAPLAMAFDNDLTARDMGNAMPGAAGNIMKAYTAATSGVKSSQKERILKDAQGAYRDPTKAEIALIASGFRLAEVARFQHLENLKREQKDYWMGRRTGLKQQYRRAVEDKDPKLKADVETEINNFNKEVPSAALRISGKEKAQFINQSRRAVQKLERDQYPQKQRAVSRDIDQVMR